MKQVLIFFIFMLISTKSLFPNESSFISYLDIANPKFTDNPASIALMSGININYDTPTVYSSKDASRQENYYGDLYDGIYDVKFEKEKTFMLSGKLALNNYGISYKKHISKFENALKNTSQYLNIKEENFEETGYGIILGKRLGRLLIGLHEEKIIIESRVKTALSSDVIYKGEYDKTTFGFTVPIAFFSLSGSFQPEVKIKLYRT